MSEIKSKKLTEGEKKELIEATVEEITSDPQMLEEIKNKLYPRIEETVLSKLETSLQT
jgi:hypothetical protein